MQNLLDLLSRCFINLTGQILVVDLVNLSFRNTLLTFFLSSCSPLSVGTHWHPPHPCWEKLFCCREGSGKLSRTCQLGKASSCLGTKMSRSSLISHQAISMLDKSLSIGLHCIPWGIYFPYSMSIYQHLSFISGHLLFTGKRLTDLFFFSLRLKNWFLSTLTILNTTLSYYLTWMVPVEIWFCIYNVTKIFFTWKLSMQCNPALFVCYTEVFEDQFNNLLMLKLN